MKELVRRFTQDRQDLLDTLKGFPADRIQDVAFGEWDLQSVLAHLAGWDLYFAEMVRLFKAGEEVPKWGDINAFNEASVAARAGRTWGQVYEEFVSAGEAFIAEYRDLEPALLVYHEGFAPVAPATVARI
jgi:hypothetical protein